MQGLDEILGQVFGGVDPFVTPILDWLARLQEHAVRRWPMSAAARQRCAIAARTEHGVIPCPGLAMAACAICLQPTCLEHAMVAANADVVCLRCVNEAAEFVRQKTQRGPVESHHVGVAGTRPRAQRAAAGPTAPSPAELRKKHLKTLGLVDPADAEEIKAAFKELVKKHHPDRVPGHRQEAAQKKFIAVKTAYEWLVANEQAAA